MTANSEQYVKGMAALQLVLDQLPVKIERNVMRGGLRAGAKVMLNLARGTTAFVDRSGDLRDSLRITTSARGGQVQASVIVGPSKSNRRPWYGHIIEGGARPHEIKAKPGGLLAIGVSRVHHPGIAPHPFMVPAFDAGHAGAVRATADYVRNRLATKHGIDVPAPAEDGDE